MRSASSASRAILLHHGISLIWQIHETTSHPRGYPEYDLDPRLCSFFPRGLETYWSSRHLDWLIYISHEDSITFAGAWLVATIQQAWRPWQQHIRRGHTGSDEA